VLAVDTLMAAIMGAEGQHSRASGRDLPLKTAVLHKRRCSTSVAGGYIERAPPRCSRTPSIVHAAASSWGSAVCCAGPRGLARPRSRSGPD